MRRSIRKNKDLVFDTDTDTATTTSIIPTDARDSYSDEHHDGDDEDVRQFQKRSDKDKAKWIEMYERLIKYKE